VHGTERIVRMEEASLKHIRNFSIIAHIDHGKTSLSDAVIRKTGTVTDRETKTLMLDSMDLERERGITIKSSAVSMDYVAQDGQTYLLNLIDTPGHVDFSYEVSRALAGCEGAVLVIDATQGVQAQTVANLYKAMELDLEVIPVVNKIDLPNIDVDRVILQIDEELALDPDKALRCSAKTGEGVQDILEAIVREVPAPTGDADAPLKALIFDSHYDPYRGTIMYVRIMQGTLRAGDMLRVMSTEKVARVEEVGRFRLKLVPRPQLSAGEVGYIISGIKSVGDTPIGDTVTLDSEPAAEPLPGFVEAMPVVFSSVFPVNTDDFEEFALALSKLSLNDASLHYQRESSNALGSGFRCGFLGLLHAEITQERLEREYNLSLFVTAPSVQYRVTMKDGSTQLIDNPAHYPDPAQIQSAEEPYIRASMIMPGEYLGNVIKLCMERRGSVPQHSYVSEKRVELRVELPLAEVIYDFYDYLKSLTRGYGSFEYELIGFKPTRLAKLEIKVNGEPVDALAMLLHEDRAQGRARGICKKLKGELPRHQFKIAIQGAVGGKIIARETVSAVRKDVTAKCYGGDISRKRKLLEKQKEGKKRMKTFGDVAIPQKAFFAVLKRNDD
jgi:GTP-binding protein LepA